jgi:hypothetical protein
MVFAHLFRFSSAEKFEMPLARPERMRWTLSEPEAGASPIELPRRAVTVPALILFAMFLVFAGVLVVEVRGLHPGAVNSVSDLAGMLFRLFWALGWSLGVVVLGALSVLLGFYRESLYIRDGRLVSAPRIGPLRMLAEYDLARIRNLRIEPQAGEATARVRFDYGEGSRNLGDLMPRTEAEKIVAAIRAALPPSSAIPGPAAVPPPAQNAPPEAAARPLSPGAVLALVAANAVPLLGVLFGGWRLDQVMVLFWAESAVVAFYTLAKMAVVGRWLALPAGLFFLAHFGAFMAIHFLFIYDLFVRGTAAAGREPGAVEALTGVFAPLWPALLALFLSHGVSFALNFLGRAEHRGMKLAALMASPYKRVVLMQLTLIFGGWMALLLHDARPALALLIALKIVADVHAHRRERALSLA